MEKIFAGALFTILLLPVINQTAAAEQPGFNRTNHRGKHVSLPAFKKGEPYSAVRARLMSSGWQPASTADADQCEKGDGRCEGRPEMQECAGTGEANCNFRWRKANMIIDVNTIKDEPVVTSVSRCRYQCR